jgi:hypothetical protein
VSGGELLAITESQPPRAALTVYVHRSGVDNTLFQDHLDAYFAQNHLHTLGKIIGQWL